MPQSLPEARSWYQKSAEKDFKEAQAKLAEFHAQGYGMEQPSPIEAYAWYTIARPPLQPNPSIDEALTSLCGQLTKKQIVQADKRVESYRKNFTLKDMSAAKDDFKK